MVVQKIEIEDDSDYATCTSRHAEAWQMLRDVKCRILDDVTCQECGRTVSVCIEDDGTQDNDE